MKLLTSIFTALFISFSPVKAQIDHWETVVYENDLWNYLVPSSPVDLSWNTFGFDDASWSIGAGGFGYGDGDDNTILPGGTLSVFQRIEFTIFDLSNIEAAILNIDYDDSFVAFLNGVEISRDLLTGTDPAWNQFSNGLHEAQMYSGGYPNQYVLDNTFLSANLLTGTNVLAVQTHNESTTSSDMSSRVYLHLGITDASSDYGPTPTWFNPPVVLSSSNLPIVVINTVGNVTIPNEPKVSATMGIIHNESGLNTIGDPYNEFFGEIGIEIRGSSSSSFPKKAFGLETRGPDSSNYNVSIFDWPSDNDWILYAPYSDKSLIRNVLTYKIGNELGMWAPRTQMVEVVINGQYEGVYVFMERIKQNPGRVNIDKLNYEDTTGVQLSGGYILKIDKTTSGGIIAWTSPYPQAAPATGPIYYQLHDPEYDTLNPLQLGYIQDYVTDFETALSGPDFGDPLLGYENYIDVNSFIDFMIVNEISKNVDGYRISTFLHKKSDAHGGKLYAGPLWDFNLAWGNANYCEGGLTTGWEIYFNDVCGGGGALNNPFWWNKLVTDPDYTRALNCRWQELRQTTLHTDTLLAYISEMEIYLSEAADRNFNRWPILGTYVWPNNFIGSTYVEEINYLRSWLSARLDWMDDNMFGACADLQIEEEHISFEIYPNPAQETIVIQQYGTYQTGQIIIQNTLGENVLKTELVAENQVIDIRNLESGIYLVNLINSKNQIKTKKLIIH
ncbi:MAG: CotH kinase family protein [Crocinitomicaceae bacterium]|nr:CotH kinase family protein [Crocinitomicaceae bacterium]